MTRYTLIDPVTGKQRTLSELELTRNLQLNCILLRDREHIGIITHRDLVIFARWCAGETLTRLKGDPDQRVTHALSLVDRWLEDEKSLTSEELEDAAASAAEAAADVHVQPGAVLAASAAEAAAEAALDAALDAAWAAANAAWAANATWVASYEAQAQWFVQHLQSGNSSAIFSRRLYKVPILMTPP